MKKQTQKTNKKAEAEVVKFIFMLQKNTNSYISHDSIFSFDLPCLINAHIAHNFTAPVYNTGLLLLMFSLKVQAEMTSSKILFLDFRKLLHSYRRHCTVMFWQAEYI